jgi:hypothetical protein
MPIFLRAPEYKPGGPDSKGWNRLSLGAHYGQPSGQCALLPRSYGTLFESGDTRRAQWGSFGPCTRNGDCNACPVLRALLHDPTSIDTVEDRVAVRVIENGTPIPLVYVMGNQWTWAELTRLRGWRLGRRFRDEEGEGFWLIKVPTPDSDSR